MGDRFGAEVNVSRPIRRRAFEETIDDDDRTTGTTTT